jgi:hypothetical protein
MDVTNDPGHLPVSGWPNSRFENHRQPRQTLMSRHPSKWVKSLELDQGEFAGDSSRGLLSLSFDPQPSARKLEKILERVTVKDTLRRCHPRFWTM